MLGDTTEEITSASTDLNNCNKVGIVYYWGNIEPVNSPFNWGALENIIKQGDTRVQICRYRASNINNRKIVWRSFEGNVWTPWYQIYDESILTNSTLLSPLVSALGVLKFYTTCTHTTGAGFGNAKWTKIATADWEATEGVLLHMTLLVVGGGAYSNYSFVSLLSIARHNANILAKYKVLIGSDIQCGYTLAGNHIDIYLHPTQEYNDYVHVCLLARNSGDNCDVVKELNALSAQPSGWVSISAD